MAKIIVKYELKPAIGVHKRGALAVFNKTNMIAECVGYIENYGILHPDEIIEKAERMVREHQREWEARSRMFEQRADIRKLVCGPRTCTLAL